MSRSPRLSVRTRSAAFRYGRKKSPHLLRLTPPSRSTRGSPRSAEPLAQFNRVAVRVADLGAGIGRCDTRAPGDVDTLCLQIVDRAIHILDFERDQAIT